MEPDILQTNPDAQPPTKAAEPPGPLLPSLAVGKSLQGVVQGGLSTVYLHLLSLRVGLLGWYFCLKQMQWDFLCWIHASMELATDVVFCWAQNALLACMMLLLLAWKVRTGVKLPGWRSLLRRLPLQAQLAWGLSLVKSFWWNLGRLWVQTAWVPACCLAWLICCVARTLEISYQQAAKMAQDAEEEEEATEPVGPTKPFSPPAPLQGQAEKV